MAQGVTVKKLFQLCQDQIAKGNGDKQIIISDDDEGNGYHTLFYEFTDDFYDIQGFADEGLFHDNNKPEDVVILG